VVNRESARSRRYGNIHALAVLRIVSSALAEERHGAHGIDTLRRSLADMLMRTSRLVDCCARIGSDEFAVMFVETTSSGVEAWHARVAAAIEVWNRVHTASGLLLDVSIGVADSHDAATWANRDTNLIELAQRRARKEQPQWHERTLDPPPSFLR
jgi:GGDEF domain-containing protein